MPRIAVLSLAAARWRCIHHSPRSSIATDCHTPVDAHPPALHTTPSPALAHAHTPTAPSRAHGRRGALERRDGDHTLSPRARRRSAGGPAVRTPQSPPCAHSIAWTLDERFLRVSTRARGELAAAVDTSPSGGGLAGRFAAEGGTAGDATMPASTKARATPCVGTEAPAAPAAPAQAAG